MMTWRDLDLETRAHIEEKALELMESGVPEAEAWMRARREFGNATHTIEASREVWGWIWLEHFWQDLRYGIRSLVGNPALSAIAIATLALGIGGITAIFAAFDAILIRPLPYADADRLVMIWDRMDKTDITAKHNSTPAEWIEWRRLNTVFTDLASSQPGDMTLSGDGEPEQVPARKVSGNFWSVLGVRPILGRGFTEDEDNRSVRVAVISYGLWQRRFGGVPNIIGRKISLNNEPYEVLGVMPRNFYFMPSREIDLWVPASFPPWMRRSFFWHDVQIVARVRPGIMLEGVRQSMDALSLQVTAKDVRGPHSVIVLPLREEIARKTRTALILLLCASVALLLIACINLANLLLSRATARGREVSVRVALGAGRGRLVTQFLTESLVLAAFGALAGLVIAVPAMRFLERIVPEAMGAARLTLDWRVLAFCSAVTITAAVTFGLAPALRGSLAGPQQRLHGGGRGATGSRRYWLQHSLIVIETALAVVLLTCGCLLLETFQHLRGTNLGFERDKLLTFETPLLRYKDFDRRVAFLNAELDALRALPGVINAGAINQLPFTNIADATFYWLEGQTKDNIPKQVALKRDVSRDYFATVRASLQAGRFFSAADQASKLRMAIVNETFARRNYSGRSPLGQRFKFGETGERGYWYTIIGVVKPIREAGVLEDMKPTVYRLQEHCDQVGSNDVGIVIRTNAEPMSIASAARKAIWSVDQSQPVARIRTMDEIVDRQLSTPTQSTALVGAFAALALLLASIGLYGVLSYAVATRTNEIGVRMALGATSNDILFSFGGRGLGLTISGLAVGLTMASIAARAMTALLYDFQPSYAATAVAVSTILLSVAALASFIPARRASCVEPIVALRHA